jgi:hypothetical protein
MMNYIRCLFFIPPPQIFGFQPGLLERCFGSLNLDLRAAVR